MTKYTEKELFESVPVSRAVATLAVPTIISQVVTMIYNLADTFFIGQIGDPYMVAAVSLVSPWFNLLTALGNLFGLGAGSPHTDSAVPGSQPGYHGICPQLSELGGGDRRRAYYGQPKSGAPAAERGLCKTCQHRHDVRWNFKCDPGPHPDFHISDGSSRRCRSYSFFQYHVGGIFYHSVSASEGTGVGFFKPPVFYLPLCKADFLRGPGLRFCHYPGKCIQYGNRKTGCRLRRYPGAAYGVVKKIDQLPLNVSMGLCQGFMPLVGYNYASGNYKRMRKISVFSWKTAAVMSACFVACFAVFAPEILVLFIREEQTAALGAVFLRIACLAVPLTSINFLISYTLQAMGKGTQSAALTFSRQGLVNIPLLILLNQIFGLYGMIWTQLVTELIMLPISLGMYWATFRKLRSHVTAADFHRKQIG